MWEIEAQKCPLGDNQTAYDKERETGTTPRPYVLPSLVQTPDCTELPIRSSVREDLKS
jgi:hypothetical protein